MRTRLLLLLLAVSLLANAALLLSWRAADRRDLATRRYVHFLVDSLGSTLTFPEPPPGPEGRDSVYWQWVGTTARIQSRRWQDAVQHWRNMRGTLLDLADVEMLRRDGLTDPGRQLRDSLMAHPEVIPFKPVEGGNMFFPPSEIVLLSPPYVFAQAEDGHIGGAVLLRYEVYADGRIAWRTLWSELD